MIWNKVPLFTELYCLCCAHSIYNIFIIVFFGFCCEYTYQSTNFSMSCNPQFSSMVEGSRCVKFSKVSHQNRIDSALPKYIITHSQTTQNGEILSTVQTSPLKLAYPTALSISQSGCEINFSNTIHPKLIFSAHTHLNQFHSWSSSSPLRAAQFSTCSGMSLSSPPHPSVTFFHSSPFFLPPLPALYPIHLQMLFSLLSKCTQNLTFSHLLITSYPSGPSLPIIAWITLKDFWEVSLIYLCSLSILSVLFYLFSTQQPELSVLNTSDNVLLPWPKPLRAKEKKRPKAWQSSI